MQIAKANEMKESTQKTPKKTATEVVVEPASNKPSKSSVNQNIALTMNTRYIGLFHFLVTVGLTSNAVQSTPLNILNLLTVSFIIISLTKSNYKVIQYLVLIIELSRTPVFLFIDQGKETIFPWIIYSCQTLLLLFPSNLWIPLIYSGLSVSCVLILSPKTFLGSLVYPLRSSSATISQERFILFISGVFSCAVLLFYIERNKILEKQWKEATTIKDKDYDNFYQKIVELQSERNELSELISNNRQKVANHLSMLSAYSQTAHEEGGNKVRETIQCVDAHAQIINLQLINTRVFSKDDRDLFMKRMPTTRLAILFERTWRTINSLVIADNFKGTMKLSRCIPKKLNLNADRVQLLVLNFLLFLRETAKDVRFKLAVQWSDIANAESYKPFNHNDKEGDMSSLNSWRSVGDEKESTSALIFPKDHIVLDSNKCLLSAADLVDVLEGMQSNGLLKIKITVKCEEDLLSFTHHYLTESRRDFDENQIPGDYLSKWKASAKLTLKPIIYATKNSSNFLVRQKEKGSLGIEFYEVAEMAGGGVHEECEDDEGNYWAGSLGSSFLARERPAEPSSGIMQRSFAAVYKIGAYPRPDRKKVLIVDGDVWNQQFLDKFFKKNEFAITKLKYKEKLLDTVKVEYDNIDLIVINDVNEDIKVLKIAADVHSFLKIVNHPPINTIVISDLEIPETGSLVRDLKQIKLLKKPINLKELREVMMEKY